MLSGILIEKCSDVFVQYYLSKINSVFSYFFVGANQERDAYLPLAENGSRLYFIIMDLSKINNMYRFSLAAFLRLFERSLQHRQVTINTTV